MSDLSRKADRVVGEVGNQFGRALMLEAHRRIVRRTPVDRGTARANWNVSVGAPSLQFSEIDASDIAGYLRRVQEQEQEITGINLFDGDVGWIANGLPYIEALEYGWSRQAPGGMVRVTVEELRAWAHRAARNLKRG